MKIGLGIILFFFASQSAVVIEALDSWHNKIFLPSQMMAQYGRPGINFSTHLGMWSDMFLLPILLCYMLLHSASWSLERDWLPILIGVVVTVANQFLLSNSTRPDPIGFVDLKWSLTIAIHFVYMATYIAIIGHFYFNPVGVDERAVALVSILLGIHVAAGTHVFLGMAQLIEHWEWCPDLLADPNLPYVSAVVWLLLSALAWFAAGRPAGLAVAGTGIVLASAVIIFASWVQNR